MAITNRILPLKSPNVLNDLQSFSFYMNAQQYLRGSAAEPSDGENVVTVGRYPSDANFEGFLGEIDDVRIYSRELSSAEVTSLYGTRE